jgi:hypothetical protein
MQCQRALFRTYMIAFTGAARPKLMLREDLLTPVPARRKSRNLVELTTSIEMQKSQRKKMEGTSIAI